MEYIYSKLKEFGKVKVNYPLAKLSNFKVGGPADFLLIIKNTNRLVAALNFLTGEGIDYLILGGGSNIVLPDDGWRGVVIVVKTDNLKVVANTIYAEAGVDLSKVVDAATAANLTGFEWAAGIPGSVGGAVRGNAGARYKFTGGEIKDVATWVKVWRNSEEIELANKDCDFAYRESIFKHSGDVVLGVTLELNKGNKANSLQMIQKIITERQGKQAKEPSGGSFFKNVFLEDWKRDQSELPERFLYYKKIAAGWLIEQAGLKGYRVGTAAVSPSHANFIVNNGSATQADIIEIVAKVKEEVYNKFGIQLEEEVKIIK